MCLAGDPAAASYLVQALWNLNRKQEAATHWQKFSQRPPGEHGQQEGQGRCVEGWVRSQVAAHNSYSSTARFASGVDSLAHLPQLRCI